MAKTIINNAKEKNELLPGQKVVEATSGNTGIALAMVCAVLDHPFTAFMSEGNCNERIDMMKFFRSGCCYCPTKREKIW